jgi:dolichyl-phosphate-mannose-protein mannosyltransferase
VTLQHAGTNHYLHSHEHKYPLRYDDGRISSEGQQVLGYVEQDRNSIWEIVPVDTEMYPAQYTELSDKEKKASVRWVRHGSIARLRHVGTDTFMVTHDVASPLTKTNMEITTLSQEKADKRFNETVWRINLVDADDNSHQVIKSKKHLLIISNVVHSVSVHTFKKPLPDWGFKMQEINGNKKVLEHTNRWTVINVTHSSIGIFYQTRI